VHGIEHGLGWQTFQVKDFGTTVDSPAGIFSQAAGKAKKGTDHRFNSADGRATLTIYALENADGDTLASYLRKNYACSALRSAMNTRRGNGFRDRICDAHANCCKRKTWAWPKTTGFRSCPAPSRSIPRPPRPSGSRSGA
jgi:hypothetical protein